MSSTEGPEPAVNAALHSTRKNVLTLLSGTGTAQILTFLTLLIAARLFSDASFGIFAAFTSLVGVVAPIAALRYDLAVMLPEHDAEARKLLGVARASIAILSVAMFIGTIVAQPALGDLLGDPHAARWMLLCGPSVFLVAESTLFQYWLNREGSYRAIASNRLLAASSTSAPQIGLGLAGRTSGSTLIIGQVLGQFVAWVRILLLTRTSLKEIRESSSSRFTIAKRYIRMPLLNGTHTLFDALRLNGVNLLIGATSVSELGQFNMAWRLTMAPLAIINASVSQVLFRNLSRTRRGYMKVTVTGIILRILLPGLPVFTAAYFLAPLLSTALLGEAWRPAGEYARALCPWLLMMLVTSPISTVFIVADRQGLALAHGIVYCIVPLALIHYSPHDLQSTVEILSWMMALILVVLALLSLVVSHSYDRMAGSPSTEGEAS